MTTEERREVMDGMILGLVLAAALLCGYWLLKCHEHATDFDNSPESTMEVEA